MVCIPEQVSIINELKETKGFSGGSDSKESTQKGRDLGLIPGSRRSPKEGNTATPVFLTRESHGQRNIVGYSPWGGKESNMTE